MNRRGLLRRAGLIGAAAGLPLRAALAQEAGLRIVDLRAEGLVDPTGIQDQDVRLSWRLEGDRRGITQTRCEVQAASTRALLEAGTPDLWWAGEVLIRRSMDMGWLGARLTPRQKIFWRVVVRDDKAVRATSAVATFEMGALDGSTPGVPATCTQTARPLFDNAAIQGLWQKASAAENAALCGSARGSLDAAFWDGAAFDVDVRALARRSMAGLSEPDREDIAILLPWTLWQRCGDTALAERNWAAMVRHLRTIADASPGDVRRGTKGYADPGALDASTPGDLIATALWKRAVDAMAAIAHGAKRQPEAERYDQLSRDIADAFAAAFVKPDGTVGGGSQSAQALALRFGLVPEALRDVATAKLVADVRQRGGRLSTGRLGTVAALDVLVDAGEAALVHDLLLRGDLVGGDALSGFLLRRVAGIDPVEPGFLKWRFAPVLDPRLPRGGASYDSVLGRIVTDWTHVAGRFEARITVPGNSRAEVWLPAASLDAVREGGRALRSVEGVTVVGVRDGRVVLEVGSGEYVFTVA